MPGSARARAVDMAGLHGGPFPRGTRNRLAIFVDGDMEPYMVKLNRNGDFTTGINELVCCLAGICLGLPLFEPVIARVSQATVDANPGLSGCPPGRHFALPYLPGFETLRTWTTLGRDLGPDMVGNVGLVPDFLIFDKYIENMDRHDGNICLLPSRSARDKVDYWLFDHDLAFKGNRSAGGVSALRSLESRIARMYYLTGQITHMGQFDRIIAGIESLRPAVPGIIGQVPVEWREAHGDYVDQVARLLGDFDRNMAVGHVMVNKSHLPSLSV